jgi:putative oxygen-independent coproporphyrinogen III oxidase
MSFSVYVHWPFCLSKCPYCDFNSHVASVSDYDIWHQSFKTALLYHKNHFKTDRVDTIFFGGGTPSLMPPWLVEKILLDIDALFGFADDIEITLEANPTSVEAQKFIDYKQAGVNRLSMGIQALNDADLRALGRTHSVSDAMCAFETAKSVFNNVSFDLIYARQNQTLSAWEKELHYAMTLAIDHISLYQLTIEEGTMFANWYKRGKITVPNDELCEEMYFMTSDILASYGYDHYEISNFAKPNKQARHNLAYWNYRSYLGIGAGSHGRVFKNDGTLYATVAEKMPQNWLNIISKNDDAGFVSCDVVPESEQILEYVLMGLRLSTGIDLTRYPNLQLNKDKLFSYRQMGLLDYNDTHLWLTQRGRPVMNSILADIL